MQGVSESSKGQAVHRGTTRHSRSRARTWGRTSMTASGTGHLQLAAHPLVWELQQTATWVVCAQCMLV
jgi:hypothetical protein